MFKRLLSSPLLQFLVGRAIGLSMRLAGSTTRWRDVDRGRAEEIWASGAGVIACVWHGRFFLVHKLWSFAPGAQPAKMLISRSREGGIVAHAARMVGADVIRGSSAKVSRDGGAKRKGGFEAMREMARHIGEGGCVCMTPDGPRGPRMRAQMGPVQLAKLTGAPLLCMAWSTRGRTTLNSWDRFLLPWPFGAGVRVWGAPIHVARDADANALEAARLALETEMNRIAAEADRLAGAPVIEPAALTSARGADMALAQ